MGRRLGLLGLLVLAGGMVTSPSVALPTPRQINQFVSDLPR